MGTDDKGAICRVIYGHVRQSGDMLEGLNSCWAAMEAAYLDERIYHEHHERMEPAESGFHRLEDRLSLQPK